MYVDGARLHGDRRSAFPSDTNLLVDACIARVREAAHLDEDVVLPLLPPLPVVAPRRDVMIMTKSDTEAAGRAGAFVGKEAAHPRREAPTQGVPGRRSRSNATSSRWPMALCGFVAGAAACAALLASPLGHRPDVERVTRSARSHAADAAKAMGAAASSIAR